MSLSLWPIHILLSQFIGVKPHWRKSGTMSLGCAPSARCVQSGASPAQNPAGRNLSFLLSCQLREVKRFVSSIHYVLSMVSASEYVINVLYSEKK